MRTAALLLALAAAGPIALPAAAVAGPPPIVRPADEARLSPHELGRQLFAANCSVCHGSLGRGVPRPTPGSTARVGQGPSLIGVGTLAPDFYLRTGYMPLGDVPAQPVNNPVQFHEPEIRALVDYVDSLSATPGPSIPRPDPASGSLSEGMQLFTEHCAGCHQAVAQGGVVTGARVPPLKKVAPVQIAEAVRIGPYLMPKFDTRQISDAELNSIIRYVEYAKHPDDRGGWGINHLGPFPEGLVTWWLAIVVLLAVCIVIGERARRA